MHHDRILTTVCSIGYAWDETSCSDRFISCMNNANFLRIPLSGKYLKLLLKVMTAYKLSSNSFRVTRCLNCKLSCAYIVFHDGITLEVARPDKCLICFQTTNLNLLSLLGLIGL